MKIPGCLLATISVVGLFLNCTPNRFIPLSFQDSKTSIRPDSFLVIPLKGIQVNSFAFSPIELDKIWTTGVNNPSEIDLKTDSITPLTQKLGDWPLRELKESEWAIDPYEPEKIWFAQFDLGAAQWSKKNGLIARFPDVKPATCFAFQPKMVWIGTANGLWRFDRATGKTAAEHGFPNEWVGSIVVRGDSLIINNSNYYLPANGQYGEWRAPWADAFCRRFEYTAYEQGHTLLGGIDENGYNISFVWTKAGRLFKHGDEFRVRWSAVLENEVWANDAWGNINSLDLSTGEMHSYGFNQNEHPRPVSANSKYVFLTISDACLMLEKKTGIFGVLPQGDILNARQIEMDDFNLYVLYNDRFEIISLDWLWKNAASRDQHLQKRAWREQMRAAFQINVRGFYPALAAYDTLIAKYGERNEWQNLMLGNAWNQVVSNLGDHISPDTLEMVTKDMKSGRFTLPQQRDIAAMIFNTFGQEANLKQAKHWGKELISLLDTSKVEQLRQKRSLEPSLKSIQRASFRFDSIGRYALSPDARLFAEADILLEYCYNSSFFAGNVCYDIRLATAKWEEIIKKHPQSMWADNAELQLLETICYGCGGGPGPEEIQRYAAILDKYPDSELKPNIWMDLAWWHLYANEYEEQGDKTHLEHLKIAKRYFDLIRNNFPEETHEKGFKEMEERLVRVMERLLWEITIAPEKKEIQPGESVKMVVSFKNKAATPRNLHFWDQGYWLLDFQVVYLSEAGCETVNAPFFEGEKPQTMNPSIIVNPGKTHREVIELSKIANKRGQCGRFDFSKKGMYDIYLELGQEAWDDRTRTSGARIFAQ
ncbi:MAG: hypothetical protein H7246_10305 [Phycisphaerae bacterium]|nr:hypothetical protein [Saprospiraceae bacterium]